MKDYEQVEGDICHAHLKLKLFLKIHTHMHKSALPKVIKGCSFDLLWTGLVAPNIEITYKTRHEKFEKHFTQYGLRLTKTYRLRGY